MKLKTTDNIVFDYNTRLEIDMRVNIDRTIIERSVYNSFHLASDIGGFYGLLASFATTLLSFINF